jgi:hypothetical protein
MLSASTFAQGSFAMQFVRLYAGINYENTCDPLHCWINFRSQGGAATQSTGESSKLPNRPRLVIPHPAKERLKKSNNGYVCREYDLNDL